MCWSFDLWTTNLISDFKLVSFSSRYSKINKREVRLLVGFILGDSLCVCVGGGIWLNGVVFWSSFKQYSHIPCVTANLCMKTVWLPKKLNLGSVWNTLGSFSHRARFVVLGGNYHPVGFEFRVRRIDHAYIVNVYAVFTYIKTRSTKMFTQLFPI